MDFSTPRNVAQVQEARKTPRKPRLRLPSQHEQGEGRQEDIQARSRSKTPEKNRQQSRLILNYPPNIQIFIAPFCTSYANKVQFSEF